MCKHESFAKQINDLGRKFVNEVSNNVHEMTGTRQLVTSTFHPQLIGLVEHQN